jgi:hyperosmotically inducible periplasmic protein
MKSLLKNTAAAGLLAAAVILGAGCSGGDNARSTGQAVDDAAVTTKVKAAFAQDPAVKAIDVKVDTFKGTVQLNGWVNTAEDKAKAEQVAKTVAGVKAVDNKLSIKTER